MPRTQIKPMPVIAWNNASGTTSRCEIRLRDAQREVDVHRLLAAHAADDREGQSRPEGEDRPADVQERER